MNSTQKYLDELITLFKNQGSFNSIYLNSKKMYNAASMMGIDAEPGDIIVSYDYSDKELHGDDAKDSLTEYLYNYCWPSIEDHLMSWGYNKIYSQHDCKEGFYSGYAVYR